MLLAGCHSNAVPCVRLVITRSSTAHTAQTQKRRNTVVAGYGLPNCRNKAIRLQCTGFMV